MIFTTQENICCLNCPENLLIALCSSPVVDDILIIKVDDERKCSKERLRHLATLVPMVMVVMVAVVMVVAVLYKAEGRSLQV